MSLPPPNLPPSVPWEVREYLRRLSESYDELERNVRGLGKQVKGISTPSTFPTPATEAEMVESPSSSPLALTKDSPSIVQTLGQLPQGQFTYAPILSSLPMIGDPLSQDGQIIFLLSGTSYIIYTFYGSLGQWVAGSSTAIFSAQAANLVYAGPATGAAAVPTFRALVLADIPINPSCLAFNSGNQSIPNASETLITYDSELYDTDTIHSTSSNTGRLTAKTAGKYSISLNINFANNSTNIRFASIRLNGTTLIGAAASRAINDGAFRSYLSVSAQYILAVNDYVDSTAYQDSGGALNIEATGKQPNFSMALVST